MSDRHTSKYGTSLCKWYRRNCDEKAVFLKLNEMVSMELIMKIPQDLIVRSLVYLEMIQMITWQSVGQNGYIKME